jgi:hypothetical protein
MKNVRLRHAAAPLSSVMNWRRLSSDIGLLHQPFPPPLVSLAYRQATAEELASPWGRPGLL